MKKCPNCGKYAENEDTICPACFQSLPVKPDRRLPIGGLGIVAVLFLLLLLIFGGMLVKQKYDAAQRRAVQTRAAPTSTFRPDAGDRISAFEVCTKFVRQKLANPETAKFSNQFSESTVAETQPGHWEIHAFYEVKNIYGGLAKNNFTCKVKYVGGGQYELEELSLVE